MEPDALISDFLCGLPETIRSDIVGFVLLYAFDVKPHASLDMRDEIENRLSSQDGFLRFGPTIRAVSATDYVLQRVKAELPSTNAKLNYLVQKLKDDSKSVSVAEKLKLRNVMRSRHFEAAYQTWLKLRSTELSNQSLMDFEDSLLKTQDLE